MKVNQAKRQRRNARKLKTTLNKIRKAEIPARVLYTPKHPAGFYGGHDPGIQSNFHSF